MSIPTIFDGCRPRADVVRGAVAEADFAADGGKTHGLIALAHVARGLPPVAGTDDFVDAALLPRGEVRFAAFDG